MTAGASAMAPLPLARVAGYLLGIAGLAFCIALLWLGMRAVMDLGGFCASGGPYEIAVECPDAVIATTPLSILGGFLAAGLIIWGAAGLPGAWMSLVFLAWPALFLSLGWNFLEYGFFPPEGGWVWSWLFCGVLFVLMGAVPLVIGIAAFRAEGGGGRAYASGRVVVRPRPSPPEVVSPPVVNRAATPSAAPVMRGGRCAGGPARAAGRDAPAGRPHDSRVRDRQGSDPGRSGGRRMNGSFQPVWLRVAVILAAIAGVLVAVWLFALLATSGG